jgi:hypothetical protein
VPARGPSRFVPLFVIVALILGLGIVYGPGVIRAWKFRATVNAMLDDIEAGRLQSVSNYVLPDQRERIAALVTNSIARHYSAEIGNLKLTNYYREDNHVWAVITAKQKNGAAVGQGKLRWVWNGKQWELDALSSYVSMGIIGVGEAELQSVGDWMDQLGSKGGNAEDTFEQL